MLRFAFISLHSSPLGQLGGRDTGGMSTYLVGLSKALSKAGHSVDIFTAAPRAEPNPVIRIDQDARLIHLNNDPALHLKAEHYKNIGAAVDAIIAFSEREGNRYDLVFSHYWLSALCGRKLAAAWKAPHLVMFHTLGRAKNETCSGENEPPARLRAEEDLAREADLLVVAAESEKKRLENYFAVKPEKIALIPCGIDRSIFRPYSSEEACLKTGLGSGWEILSVGRLEPVKGLDLLLKAAALLPLEDQFQVIVIGGEGNQAGLGARLREEAYELGLAGRFKLIGPVKQLELPYYFNCADVTVVTSHYESFGLVPLESLACGTPVVGPPVGALPELLGAVRNNGGMIVEGRDPACWAAAIRSILLQVKPLPGEVLIDGLAKYCWENAAGMLIDAVVKIRAPL